MRSDPGLLDAVKPARANEILDRLQAEAAELVSAAGIPLKACGVTREAGLRFAGQSYSLAVKLGGGRVTAAALTALKQAFLEAYRDRYHRIPASMPIELVNWRVQVAGPTPDVRLAPPNWSTGKGFKGRRPVYFPQAGDYVDCPVYDRSSLQPGRKLRGPAIIEEPESTSVIGPGGMIEVDAQGNLMATLPVARKTAAASELTL
jgi:N-methylhydantoinase A